jgi:DNA-binding NarL/FixJ family response regulator
LYLPIQQFTYFYYEIKEPVMIKVSIVEDTPAIRESLQILINNAEGFKCVSTYNSAEDALPGLIKDKPDVVLMDINLPGISGIECVRRVKETQPEIQFMMCTVYEDDDSIFEALKAGASGYILKKTPPKKMLESIRDLHDGGAPMSSQIARRVVDSMQHAPVAVPAEAAQLTRRERELLEHLAKGYRYKEIADILNISTETVRKHVHNIYEKLHVQSRVDALNKIYQR